MMQFLLSLVVADFFGLERMSVEVMFGLKIVALVMLYGYMHMNLGGGVLSTAIFLVFGYYFVFYANGMLAIMILALFFLMIHGFDLLWGGDIVKGNLGERMAAKQQAMEGAHWRPHVPP